MKYTPPILAVWLSVAASAAEIHVRPEGPLRTLAEAQREARKTKAPVIIYGGTYYLPETLVLNSEDSGTEYRAAESETVVISGGLKLDLQWSPFEDGIMQAKTPPWLTIDQLFVNGQRQMMARYPNYDASILPYGGFAADAFSKERAARWSDPAGGFVHAMHRAHWGGYHYRITGKDAKGEVTYEGGWQNNRQMGMHPQHRFVENIFEELDVPGEWFHNAKTDTLYYFPPADVDLTTATVEIVRLRHLVEFNGARNVTLRGFIFRHTARTFMDTKEPLLRSDWTIYRGGALLFQHAEDCTVQDCEFDQLGGNAVFVNGYNRQICVVGCDIHDTGASAVAFVGDPKSVRNPLFEYRRRQSYAQIDKTPGPKADDYPADSVVDDCLIRHVGVVEKQATGVQISMAMGITVRHCSIYDTSRAGINISEGTFGGHLIEFCDVFDTVKETGDHGSFNSWGRDRYWGLREAPAEELPQLALLDAVKPTVLRNNRWRCDHGWDVDLDDGSSNYEIYDNLFLHGGLKLREGFHRRVWNNIAVNNTLHPHCWFEDSGDEVTKNIWMGAYRPAGGMPKGKWGKEVDHNLFTTSDADRTKFAEHGCDANSLVGDPMFVDPVSGDYRVKDDSPALTLGFENFPMNEFGVQSPRLKKIARTPELPRSAEGADASEVAAAVEHYWQAARVKELEGEEFSAFGVSKESGGVQIVAGSVGEVKAGDLVQSLDGKPVKTIADLFRLQNAAAGRPLDVGIVRGQQPQNVRVESYAFVATESGQPTDGVSIRAVTTRPDTKNEPVTVLSDGKLARNYGPVFSNGTVGGAYKVDLGASVNIASVATWSYNLGGRRGPQKFVLFGSNVATDPGWNRDKFTSIAEVDTTGQKTAEFPATIIRAAAGKSLGSYRWLMWVAYPVTSIAENTAFQEFQINAVP
jgi:hypothetical protein